METRSHRIRLMLIPLVLVMVTAPASHAGKEDKKILEVVVWDDTSKNPPGDRMEVWVKGHGSWFPNVENGSDKKALGSFPVGEPNEFYLYPDGRDGAEIKIPFTMTREMISGSVMPQTIINIYDSKVEVVGQAIPDRTKEYPR